MLFSRKSKFTLFVALLVLFHSFGQQYPSRNYSTLDGLPNNSVYSVFKDSRGILWIGTANGVSASINGKIINFSQADGLAYNNCWSIVEDENHHLWFGSYGGGLTFYDGKKFKIINESNGLVNNFVRRLFVSNNQLYVGTNDGISILNVSTFQCINHENPFSKSVSQKGKFQMMDFFQINKSIYAASYLGGFWKISRDFKSLKHINYKNSIFSTFVQSGVLYISQGGINNKTIDKIKTTDLLAGKTPRQYVGKSIIWQFTADKAGKIYGAGFSVHFPKGGIYKLSGNNETEENNRFNIKSKQGWCVFFDKKNDLIYLGTIDNGLYEVSLKNEISFHPFSSVSKENVDLNFALPFKKSMLYVYSNGLLIRGKVNKTVTAIEFHNYLKKCVAKNPLLKKHYYFTVLCFRPLNELSFLDLKTVFNRIYVNTTFGLFILNENGKFEDYYPIQSLFFKPVTRNNILFQLSYGTVSNFHFHANDFVAENYALTNPNNPRDVLGIVEYEDVYYYISRYHGLFSSRNFKFKSFVKNNIWQEKELSALTTDGNGTLFISNSFGDVFEVCIKKGFQIIKKIAREEIIGNSILFLAYYKGFLIVGTEKGISLYRNGKTIFIDEDLGLVFKNITKSDVQGNYLYLTTSAGYYTLNLPKLIKRKTPNPKVHVAAISINYKQEISQYNHWFSYDNKEIQLPFDKNNLSLKIGFENFQFPNKLVFQHKIIGLKNTGWSNWTNYNYISLNYLPPGKYIVLIHAKNTMNGKSIKSRLLIINIHPPFWQSWWFILSLALILLLIIFVGLKKRIRFIQQQERTKGEINKRLAETKMEALQSQMNPHFIFNALNSIQNYIIDEKADNALMYMSAFSKLMRQTLNNSSKSTIRLDEELSYINSYISLENMRVSNTVSYKLSLAPDIESFDIELPPMLIQPFVENVFIHAFDSTIINPTLAIDILLDSDFLIIIISDNGKGIQQTTSVLSESKGIRLTNERIQLISGSQDNMITFSTTKNGGTTVRLAIPLN